MNFLKKFIRTSAVDEVALIPSGKLYLARLPTLPKGASECLYNDALITIKQTTTPYFYQLAVIRAYEEGEASSLSDGEADEDDDNEGSLAEAGNADERVFLLAPELRVRISTNDNGTRVIGWKDVNGDVGDRFEFVVDEDIRYTDVDHFMLSMYRCLYESKYQKPSVGVENADLAEFVYEDDGIQEDLPGIRGLREMSQWEVRPSGDETEKGANGVANDSRRSQLRTGGLTTDELRGIRPRAGQLRGTTASEANGDDDDEDDYADALNVPIHLFAPSLSEKHNVVYSANCDLCVYDPDSNTFRFAAPISAQIIQTDQGVCLASDTVNYAFAVLVSQELNYSVNIEHRLFNFNYAHGALVYTLLLRFPTVSALGDFQTAYLSALVGKFDPDAMDIDYINDAFGHLDISSSDTDYHDAEDHNDTDNGSDAEEAEDMDKAILGVQASQRLFVSSDSEDEYDDRADMRNERRFLTSAHKNRELAVGQANDRSFVTRGDSLGVYKRSEDGLEFYTAISGVKDLQGKLLQPHRTMLHRRDQYLLMTGEEQNSNMYVMDLTRGQVVETWDAGHTEKLEAFGPVSRFAGLTDEQMLSGISANSTFRIDPRLSGNKVVMDKTLKQYKTKNNGFQNMAVTDKGYQAVGLANGAIRLFDRPGLNAKTLLPALGELFVGLDVSKDGRWLLATCKTYLLLVDNKIGPGQKNAGSLGFEKYFDADKKPVPKRLALRPQDVTQLARIGGKPLQFNRAVFDTLLVSEETTIIASTGPFEVLWSLVNIRKNWNKDPTYKILRYSQDVVADRFCLDSQNKVMTALRDDVALVDKSGFRAVSKRNVVDEYSSRLT